MKNILKLLTLFILISTASVAHAEIKVYFSPEGGCQKAVIAEINDAKKSIDIAMYEFTSKEIAQALITAQERHVKIRVVLDRAQIRESYSKSKYLIKKGLDVKFHMGPGLLHDKFAVIDDDVVLTGSFNWTVFADRKNAENLLVITDKSLAQKYERQFKHVLTQSGEGHFKDTPSST